ncbi:hypothetical protein, partial [Segatella buccae]|uniref:hypothetical protein n=1 Tax=Segatella buccae TaxID=28126 RepID=UPI001E310EDA
MKACISHTPIKPVKVVSTRRLMVANKLNKNTSAEIFQPEWKVGFKPSGKPTEFFFPDLRA